MSADIVERLPELPEARKPDENGAGWFTAGQMRAYGAQCAAEADAKLAAARTSLLMIASLDPETDSKAGFEASQELARITLARIDGETA